MSIINSYATLTELKNYLTPRANTINTDATDDTNLELILGSVSRWIDDQCHRTFYPRYETRYFSVPILQNSPRLLFLDDDLLAEDVVTNGDGTVLSNTIYNLQPKNYEPKYGIRIIGPASVFWIYSTSGANIGSIEYVISVAGWWGFHNHFTQRGWSLVGTLGSAISDTTTLAFTMSNGHSVLPNQILKIDKEIFNVATVATNTITPVQRGDNGSTAATHTNGASVYAWNVVPEIKQAVLMIAQSLYGARSGQVSAGKVSVTAAGVVIRPEDVPSYAMKAINSFTRISG